MKDFDLENRKLVIGGVAVVIVTVYIVRLFTLQLLSDDYRKSADSNAFLKKIEFPSRGVIRDRNGKLLVYNQPAYDIMVVMNEEKGRLDTMDFCQTLGITKEYFVQRMDEIKDRSKNPGYSRFTQQLFMSQIDDKDFSVFQEKMFRFPGFYVQKRSIRQYQYPYAAHVLGDVAEVSQGDIDEDEYYQPGDYIGKLGVERSYEKELRGEKGVQILLRDAHGRIQGKYQNGKYDRRPRAGKDLTLGIDINLQALGERLMEGKIGAIVALDPQTGQVLALVSSPSYDPRSLEGRKRSKYHRVLSRNVWKPLLNRAIMGQYPPGSTFKTSQGLTFLTEGIINSHTQYPCHHGFSYRGLHVGCHGHASPLSIVPAISTSCNSFFCWGLFHMMGNRRRYRTVQDAMNTWRDYMVSMGFGYKLGIDLPGEKRGLIPNASFYDRAYRGSWNGLTVISISIGQGEVNLTPLQSPISAPPLPTAATITRPTWCAACAAAKSTPLIIAGITRGPAGGPTTTSWPACARRCSAARASTWELSTSPSAARQERHRTAARTTPCSWASRRWTTRASPLPCTWRTAASAPTLPCPSPACSLNSI